MSVQREKSFIRDHTVNEFLIEYEKAKKKKNPLIIQQSLNVLKTKLIFQYCQEFVLVDIFLLFNCMCII